MEIIFLGTGTSHGVPMIGCKCKVCASGNPKNNRLRSSLWIKDKDTSIIIDTATEFRIQALKYDIPSIDAVLYTHFHADHVHGIDDLRRYNHIQDKAISCYGSKKTINSIKKRHSYINLPGESVPLLNFNIVKNEFFVKNLRVVPVKLEHGNMQVFGYRVGNIAYLTDCKKIPERSYKLLKNLDVLIIDGLRHKEHDTHLTIEEAIKEGLRIKPRRMFITHICHEVDHDKDNSQLPAGCELAYDGLTVGCN